MSDIPRRDFLAAAAGLTAATTAFAGAAPVTADDAPPRPDAATKAHRSLVPVIPRVEAQNRDRLAPPADRPWHPAELEMVVRRQSQSVAAGRLGTADHSPRAARRQELACVNMRLTAGRCVRCTGTRRRSGRS